MKNVIINRLKEKSTWAGIVMAVSLITGHQLPDETAADLAQMAGGAAALAAIFMSEKKGDK